MCYFTAYRENTMKLYCQFLNKGMFELHLISKTPTIRDLKIALVKSFFDISCSNITNTKHLPFSAAYLWVLFNGQNVLNHKDNTSLLSLGILEETHLKIMIRPSYSLGMQGLFQVHRNEVNSCNPDELNLSQDQALYRAKL